MNEIFSIIVPCYKNSNLLIECLDSILNQDYKQMELIICEDAGGGFDSSFFEDYIEKNKKQNLIRYEVYSNPENYGTVKNLNYAIHKTCGNYIKIIAADDVFADNSVLTKVMFAIHSSKNGCVLCDVLLCDSDLNVIKKYNSKFIDNMSTFSSEKCFEELCIRNRINAVGIFFERRFFEENGYFNEKYRLLEDWPTWLNLYKRNRKIDYYPYIAAKRRISTGVVANNNPYFLADRRLVWNDIIKPNKCKIKKSTFIRAGIGAYFYTIPFLRSMFYMVRG